jgi:hypothetical protein
LNATIGSQIHEFVDDDCGTRPPRWPWPWPPQFDLLNCVPEICFVAGTPFQKAAGLELNNPLQANFSAAADQLFEAGMKRLESS